MTRDLIDIYQEGPRNLRVLPVACMIKSCHGAFCLPTKFSEAKQPPAP
jgi:hypothetical protein